MKRSPRIRIINHRASDESELNMPWERRQALNDAIAHLKRAIGVVPDSITTGNQVLAAKRAVGSLRQEVDVVLKLLLETT